MSADLFTAQFGPQSASILTGFNGAAGSRLASTRHPIRQAVPTMLALAACCGVCGAIAAFAGLQVGAILFAIFVVGLSILRSSLVFALALLLAPFVNDIQLGVPVKVAASDLCLFIALPFVFARRHTHFVQTLRAPYWIPVIAYLGICFLSTVLTGLDREAIVSTSQMAMYLLFTVAMFAAGMGSAAEIVPRLYIFGLISATLSIAILVGGSNYVLGLHKNAAGATLAAATLVTAGLWFADTRRNRWPTTALLAVLAAGLLLSLSRGAWISVVVGGSIIMSLYGRFGQALKLSLGSVPVLAAMWLFLPESQKEYATDLSAGAHNVKARLLMIDYALGRFRESPVIGVGVGLRKTYDATNVALATLAETGVLGFVCFAAIYGVLGWMTVSTARRLNRSDPAFCLLAIGAALVFGRLAHGMVDHYWSRGAILVWAGAGWIVLSWVSSRKSGPNAAPAAPLAVQPG